MAMSENGSKSAPVHAVAMQPNWVTICNSLRDEPESWKATQYDLTHASGVSLWVANGRSCLRAHCSATDVHLGIVGRWRVWKAYEMWKRWQLPVFMTTKVTAAR
jgi:hypothetical protein